MTKIILGFSILLSGSFSALFGNGPTVLSDAESNVLEQPVELGLVKWNFDLDAASQLAKKSNKPLFVQFQEVPG